MRLFRRNLLRSGLGAVVGISLTTAAPAASTIVNSLTGFTGDSTLPATQTAATTAGLEFASIAGLAEDFSSDPTVAFGATGAAFGGLYAGDGGRNYMRTIDDYAFDSYVAEVTVVVDTLATDVVFFGMGSGNITQWGVPDFAGAPTVFMSPENEKLMTNSVNGISGDWENPPPGNNNDWLGNPAPGLLSANAGTHRLRMSFNAPAKEWVGAIDIDYAGGPFVADATTVTYTLTNMFDDGGFVTIGWPTNPSKIYFGGDDGAIFKDFSVVVGSAPSENADFNGDNLVDGQDFLIWQKNFGVGTSHEAGDADGNSLVNDADLTIWKTQFGGAPAAIASVPEPSTAILAACGLIAAMWASRRA
ncbi:hypothetical protein [Lacipirellula limnantheis]|uniref:PEP-CTERM protein-sorting domain-containing protein n=1 Tax=Lacipirellula limnantheis TaxID=2528024 RepID=A0A517TXS6_9BACT|nr:hypothetical protein [Lacipirellula limnantheis]QDT73170.1 hypothetical protein I41_23590 [Lacipirellula limnantheis]